MAPTSLEEEPVRETESTPEASEGLVTGDPIPPVEIGRRRHLALAGVVAVGGSLGTAVEARGQPTPTDGRGCVAVRNAARQPDRRVRSRLPAGAPTATRAGHGTCAHHASLRWNRVPWRPDDLQHAGAGDSPSGATPQPTCSERVPGGDCCGWPCRNPRRDGPRHASGPDATLPRRRPRTREVGGMTLLVVSLAGGVGAASRFIVETLAGRRWASSFPLATVLVNVTGSFVFGVLAGLVLFHGSAVDVRTIGGTGFCGGYTTFSAASFETVRLAERGQALSAAVNGVGTLLLAVSAAAAGLVLAGG